MTELDTTTPSRELDAAVARMNALARDCETIRAFDCWVGNEPPPLPVDPEDYQALLRAVEWAERERGHIHFEKWVAENEDDDEDEDMFFVENDIRQLDDFIGALRRCIRVMQHRERAMLDAWNAGKKLYEATP